MDRDRGWMYNTSRVSAEYIEKVNDFLDKAFAKAAKGNEICCPCRGCFNRCWHQRNTICNHLIVKGFIDNYYKWVFHGEDLPSRLNVHSESDDDDARTHDDVGGLLHDIFRGTIEEFSDNDEEDIKEGTEELTEDAKKFYKLVEEGQQELFPGCKTFSKLSFIIRLYLHKCIHGLSNEAFDDSLTLWREAIPDIKLPKSFYEAKRIVKDLGLDYEKIHACSNDCMLFYGNVNGKLNKCSSCGASRWKPTKDDVANDSNQPSKKVHNVPVKVLRYFPLKPRVQRLFMCSQTAKSMSWHSKERIEDGILRHPADGKAWKDFDEKHPEFALDPRNVRLGLASDGFNPFRTMSIAHSTWPVILINYNLPPWMCLKAEYFMLSLLIPGPQSPGNNIDIYLQPLIDELKELWEVGLLTYDASIKQSFKLRVALLWTVSDFPGYPMLSGWSTKGRLACPYCNYNTCSEYLKYSKKMCYMGHRRFLKDDHPWRFNKRSFNGDIELGREPISLSGTEIIDELSDFVNEFGKKQKKKANRNCPWKKRSVFFDLPYWEHNRCRHMLDLMHIEKNVCDNIVGTLLDIPGKTKDHVKARFDLQQMGIRRDLHPVQSADGRRVTFAKACFSMTSQEKEMFCKVLADAKVPHGCASNISRCVNVREKKISGYKTHDAHFLMQYLLQVALRRSLPRSVAIPLIRLGAFFKGLCSKVLKPVELKSLQSEIVEILCQLEKIFPPSFFDIMVHLHIHLVQQILDCGPVNYFWMYPTERYLCRLKSYVRNRSAPEGSIAEGYLAEESLTFCSLYMHDGVKTRFNRYTSMYERVDVAEETSPIFPKIGHPLGGKRKRKGKAFTLDNVDWVNAHRYALYNCDNNEVDNYIREHKLLIENQSRKRGRTNKWTGAQKHSKDFTDWFKTRVSELESAPDYLKWLSMGPNFVAKKYRG
ncbi:uncharacterized protein LOC109823267 [Asparagus officinalis]|uniref:uncharacterized protein LOC109823267 n=1 Tax=Asparagus officinalis TaxID=4686 RepID=UPI00098E42B8|nr:uncharacterized protein LOC109823267 [Asparagus officinalis]